MYYHCRLLLIGHRSGILCRWVVLGSLLLKIARAELPLAVLLRQILVQRLIMMGMVRDYRCLLLQLVDEELPLVLRCQTCLLLCSICICCVVID